MRTLLATTALLLLWSLAAPWGAASSPIVRYKFGAAGVARVTAAGQTRCSWFALDSASFCEARDPGQLFAVRAGALMLTLALATTIATFVWRPLTLVSPVLIAAAIVILLWAFIDLLVVAHGMTTAHNGSGTNSALAAAVLSAGAAVVSRRRG